MKYYLITKGLHSRGNSFIYLALIMVLQFIYLFAYLIQSRTLYLMQTDRQTEPNTLANEQKRNNASAVSDNPRCH